MYFQGVFVALCLMWGGVSMLGQKAIVNSFRTPLDITTDVSGSFAEIRPNHFHSGVDFATGGKTGSRVYAIEEGYVARIKIQSGGYGKAVYVCHPNGYTSVYAHLDRFSTRVDSFVIARHYHRQQFEIDETFEPEDMPLKKGDVIGYVGNTGSSSGPHLHFEVRQTDDEKPVDPLLFFRDVNDETPPAIMGLRVYPIENGATVAAKNQAQYLKVVLVNGVYRPEGNAAISVAGTIGLGIETVDYFTGSWRKCGIYSIAMSVNGKSHFVAEFNRFAFDQTRYVNSYMDYGYKMSTGRVVQKSFVDPYNQLDVYPVKVNDGKIDIKEGENYQIQYRVRDSYGNESVLEFTLKGTKSSPRAVDQTLINGNQPFDYEKENIRIAIPEGSFYSDVPFVVSERSGTVGAKIFSVGSRYIPLHQYITLELKIPSALQKRFRQLCLARVNASGVKTYAGGTAQGGWVSGRLRDLGDYTLAIDSVAPTVSWHNPAPSANYSGRKTLELLVKDAFSGIASYRCEIDGSWALFEYDGKTNRLICPLNRIPLTKNKQHKLKVVLVDGCGNELVKHLVFMY